MIKSRKDIYENQNLVHISIKLYFSINIAVLTIYKSGKLNISMNKLSNVYILSPKFDAYTNNVRKSK